MSVELSIPLWFEVGSLIVLSLILLLDLLRVVWKPHVPSTKESALWVGFYVALALVFAWAMFIFSGEQYGSEFLAGWVTEYSLSVDNLFVFVLIMASFSVPKRYQQEVLMVGILLAIVFRGIFILLGAALIASFSWIFYVFGAFLLVVAIQQLSSGREDDVQRENAVIRFLRTRIDMTNTYDGMKFRIIEDGKKRWTPILVVLIAIGTADVVFAVDSIPAIYGITESPFIVFTANVFALMGLRQLYFLLGDLIDKLAYLHIGIAFILGFIGVKLVFHALHTNELPFINGGEHVDWVPVIGTWESLIVIVVAMTIAVVASLMKLKKDLDTGAIVLPEPEHVDQSDAKN
ncbi:tellurite resistance protein [Pontimonas salivibrio]|uniref:Tellurite resistance protein n=1 Tax=Pontimonas salivibrio TaxID=1159327 RepID=A0A2L2BPF4_9MICO|nr:tellurite resistance protein [Pontimonas salivibrio]